MGEAKTEKELIWRRWMDIFWCGLFAAPISSFLLYFLDQKFQIIALVEKSPFLFIATLQKNDPCNISTIRFLRCLMQMSPVRVI